MRDQAGMSHRGASKPRSACSDRLRGLLPIKVFRKPGHIVGGFLKLSLKPYRLYLGVVGLLKR